MDELRFFEEVVQHPVTMGFGVFVMFSAVVVVALWWIVRGQNKTRALELAQLKAYQANCQQALAKIEKLEKTEQSNQLLVQSLQAQLVDSNETIINLKTAQDNLKRDYDRQIADLRAELKLTKDELANVKAQFAEVVKERDEAREQLAELRGELLAYKANYGLLVAKLRAPEVNGETTPSATGADALTPQPRSP